MIRIAEVLLNNASLNRAYTTFRLIAENICNPEANFNVEDLFPHKALFGSERLLFNALMNSAAAKATMSRGNVNPNTLGVAFWPFATSRENRLFARLYQEYELPPTEIMNDLINTIKTGRLSLEPDNDSGWYDYQTHALETLLLADRAHESIKLLLKLRYKKRLRKAFEALLTRRRETQVKFIQLLGTKGRRMEPKKLYPEFLIEPAATNYLRTARAYRFIFDKLKALIGEKELQTIKLDGFDNNLLKEFERIVRLYYGLYLVVCNDIVLPPKLKDNEIQSLIKLGDLVDIDKATDSKFVLANLPGFDPDKKTAWTMIWRDAVNWLKSLDKHKFMDEDCRVIVPALSNYSGTRTRNWAVVGIKLTKIKAWYEITPRVSPPLTLGENQPGPPEVMERQSNPYIKFVPREYFIPVLVFAEVTMGPKPLTRDEFRSICDKYKTKKDIVKALELGSRSGSSFLFLLPAGVAVLGVLLFFLAVHTHKRHSRRQGNA
jgi:hypothetical protein